MCELYYFAVGVLIVALIVFVYHQYYLQTSTMPTTSVTVSGTNTKEGFWPGWGPGRRWRWGGPYRSWAPRWANPYWYGRYPPYTYDQYYPTYWNNYPY